MSRPAPKVYLGFGSTWLTDPASIVWTDVTSRVMDRRQAISTVRGSTAVHGEPDTGQLDFTLRNSDRFLDPLHTTGPYFGDLIPGVPVRVEGAPMEPLVIGGVPVTINGQPVMVPGDPLPVWWGTVKSWPQRYDRGNRISTVPVTAYDGFDKLSRAKIPRSVLESEILADGPVAFWPLDETAGTTMADRSGNGNDGEYAPGTTSQSVVVQTSGGAQVPGLHFTPEDTFTGEVSDRAAYVGATPLVVEGLVKRMGTDLLLGAIWIEGAGNPGSDSFVYIAEGGAEFGAGTGNYSDIWAVGKFANSAFGPYTSGGGIDDGAVHHIAYRVTASVNTVYIDGVAATSSLFEATTLLQLAGTWVGGRPTWSGSGFQGWLSSVAVFSSDVGATRILAHSNAALAPLDGQRTDQRITWILDELGWPANLRSLQAGRTTLGPATFKPGDGALGYLRSIAATEDGALSIGKDGKVVFRDRYWRYQNTLATVSQVTFTDDGTGVGVSEFEYEPADDELIVNVARFTRRGGTEQVAVDEASRDLYGEADKQRSDLLHSSDLITRSQADWTVATRSEPVPRVPKVTVLLHNLSPAGQAQMLALDIGHRVTCTRTPQNVGSAFSIACMVDGIKHEVTASEWTMELYLSPAPDGTVSLFTLGVSELGSADVLAY